jgi:hypothetical protein
MIEPVTGTRSSRPAVFSHGSAGGRAGFAGRAELRRSEGPSSPRCQPQQDACQNTLVYWYRAPRGVVTVREGKEMEEHSDAKSSAERPGSQANVLQLSASLSCLSSPRKGGLARLLNKQIKRQPMRLRTDKRTVPTAH